MQQEEEEAFAAVGSQVSQPILTIAYDTIMMMVVASSQEAIRNKRSQAQAVASRQEATQALWQTRKALRNKRRKPRGKRSQAHHNGSHTRSRYKKKPPAIVTTKKRPQTSRRRRPQQARASKSKKPQEAPIDGLLGLPIGVYQL